MTGTCGGGRAGGAGVVNELPAGYIEGQGPTEVQVYRGPGVPQQLPVSPELSSGLHSL